MISNLDTNIISFYYLNVLLSSFYINFNICCGIISLILPFSKYLLYTLSSSKLRLRKPDLIFFEILNFRNLMIFW